jgi:DNA (cytosine-5)-methyltransferase 1
LPEDLIPEALGGAYESDGGKVGFYRRLSWDKPAPTVPTSPNQKGTCLCHPDDIRPLSVQEYARVQQFPDEWEFIGSLSERYKQIGNAVPVGLGLVIGQTLLSYIENLENI